MESLKKHKHMWGSSKVKMVDLERKTAALA